MHATGSSALTCTIGNLEAAREPAGVARAVRLFGFSGESELVVGDDVNDAADVVAVEPRQVQRFGDDALTGKRGVAVNQDAEHFLAVQLRLARAGSTSVAAARAIPTSTGSTASRWLGFGGMLMISDLRPAVAIDGVVARAGVILHVAHPAEIDARRTREQRILELGEHLRVRLLHDVRKHVQAPAVRHRNHHVLHARRRRVADDLVEDRDHHVESLDREARLARERAMQEALEHLDLGDAVEQFHAR